MNPTRFRTRFSDVVIELEMSSGAGNTWGWVFRLPVPNRGNGTTFIGFGWVWGGYRNPLGVRDGIGFRGLGTESDLIRAEMIEIYSI